MPYSRTCKAQTHDKSVTRMQWKSAKYKLKYWIWPDLGLHVIKTSEEDKSDIWPLTPAWSSAVHDVTSWERNCSLAARVLMTSSEEHEKAETETINWRDNCTSEASLPQVTTNGVICSFNLWATQMGRVTEKLIQATIHSYLLRKCFETKSTKKILDD